MKSFKIRQHNEIVAFLWVYSLFVVLPYLYIVGTLFFGIEYASTYHMVAHYTFAAIAILPTWWIMHGFFRFILNVHARRGSRPVLLVDYTLIFTGIHMLIVSLFSSCIDIACGDVEYLHASLWAIDLPFVFLILASWQDHESSDSRKTH